MSDNQISVLTPEGNSEIVTIMEKTLLSVREKFRGDQYIIEAVKASRRHSVFLIVP